ncbi:MAG TPA: hypothetical protein VHJ83_03310 [Micromonosporaceae bacterium]|jgi:hypothetical protein|nr:hypothetical protein [Micromonosporaceae bacterium]
MVTVRRQAPIVSAAHQWSRPAVLPYGGAVVVAQSIADVHRENPWTGRCLACNELSPCLERRYANVVLIHYGRETEHPRVAATLTAVIGVGLGMLLITAGLTGLLW